MSDSLFWPIDMAQLGVTTPGHGSDINEGILHIHQSSSITGASPSENLVSYSGHLSGESYPFVLGVF